MTILVAGSLYHPDKVLVFQCRYVFAFDIFMGRQMGRAHYLFVFRNHVDNSNTFVRGFIERTRTRTRKLYFPRIVV